MTQESTNGDSPAPDGAAHLFAEFDAPAYEAWREATVSSLKGVPFEKLITRTYEGIDLQPLYRAEDAADLAHVATLPGKPPYVRGSDATGYLEQPWAIAQEIGAATPSEFNRRLLHDLQRGQNAVNLIFDASGRRGVPMQDARDVGAALANVDLAAVPLLLHCGADAVPAAALLMAALPSDAAIAGAIDNDPLGELAAAGTLPASLDALYDEMAMLTRWAAANAPALRTISVRGDRYQNAGADAVTELAAALAAGVAYVRAMQARDLPVDTTAGSLTFVFGLGSNFFMEVAKLRAARLLWSQVIEAFGGNAAAQRMVIHARTADWNKTVYDPYVNMLRVTTEAFAGAVAGVQSMHVAPFDAPIREADEFSRRMARNTQLILQEECSLTRLIDPAGGSWYVERLTDELARAAWQRFQAIETAGGLAAALADGTVQQQIAATAAARVANLARRKDVLVGVNMYPNLGEAEAKAEAKAEAEGHAEDVAVSLGEASFASLVERAKAGANLAQLRSALRRNAGPGPAVEPLQPLRVAAAFEALRQAAASYAAAHGATPKIFLANMGSLKQHKARADFTQGFVNVGGFECIYPAGFETPDAAAAAALDAGAQAVVICSTDDSYPEIVPALTARIKAAAPEMPVLLAGYPTDQIDAFRAAGIDEFIHLRADCHAVNAWLQATIGIK
jgi:methylmalonyl-CoA mutase